MKPFAIVALIVMFLLSARGFGDPSPEPRVVNFDGGSAIITGSGGFDRVEMRNAKGAVSGLSVCGGGTGRYDEIVAFAKTLRELVAAGKREAVADLVLYPLRVNHASPRSPQYIKDKATLLAHYSKLFDPDALQRMQPFDVFCRDGMAMLANGYVWIQEDEAGHLKIAVINT